MKWNDQKEFLMNWKISTIRENWNLESIKRIFEKQFELSSFFEKFENYFLME